MPEANPLNSQAAELRICAGTYLSRVMFGFIADAHLGTANAGNTEQTRYTEMRSWTEYRADENQQG